MVEASASNAKSGTTPDTTDGPSGEQKLPRKVGIQKRRRFQQFIYFFLVFIVPSVIGGWYYATQATDRYATGASFVVRGLEGGGSVDLIGSVTGFTSTGSTTSDSYIIRRYLESPDLVRELDQTLKLREHYSNPSIDPISRYGIDQPFEEFVLYWSRRINTTYDATTGIVTFEVQAFDAEMTLALASEVLGAANRLVNALSESARRDSVQFATTEVERAEERLRSAQLALQEFRATEGSVDPAMNAALDAQRIAQLETQLADLSSRIITLSATMDSDAPVLMQRVREAEALKQLIDEQRAAIGAQQTNGTATADILAEFESLQIEQTFAQQRYASALTSLETARIDADRQQRYLAIFSRPFLPEEAIYPYRIRNILIVMAAAFAFWAITTLFGYAIRDHLR